MIGSAVILAAGRGSRLGGEASKPLVEIAGVPLIGRVLTSLRQAGIEEALIVLGYQADRLRRAVLDGLAGGLRVRFVFNPAWERGNGLSVLAAEDQVPDPFLLLMADHLVEPAMVQAAAAARLDPTPGVLAVDRRTLEVFDLADATKVVLRGDRIESIGKELSSFNAVDTGVFAFTRRIFAELRQAAEHNGGDCSLTQGVARLCSAGLMGWVDVTGQPWLDVDTPEARSRAEDLVAQAAGAGLAPGQAKP
jgi:choline kinase